MRVPLRTDPVAVLTCVALLVAVASCSHVAPYEREKLAHPTMQTSDVAGPAETHVRGVHEGAIGGGEAAESGCGCN
jgi:hypothetical protein